VNERNKKDKIDERNEINVARDRGGGVHDMDHGRPERAKTAFKLDKVNGIS